MLIDHLGAEWLGIMTLADAECQLPIVPVSHLSGLACHAQKRLYRGPSSMNIEHAKAHAKCLRLEPADSMDADNNFRLRRGTVAGSHKLQEKRDVQSHSSAVRHR